MVIKEETLVTEETTESYRDLWLELCDDGDISPRYLLTRLLNYLPDYTVKECYNRFLQTHDLECMTDFIKDPIN